MCPTEMVLGQGLATAGNARCRDRTQCDAGTSFFFSFLFFFYLRGVGPVLGGSFETLKFLAGAKNSS